MKKKKSEAKKSIASQVAIWTLAISLLTAAFFLGSNFGQSKFDKEKLECFKQRSALELDTALLKGTIDSLMNKEKPQATYDIFSNGSFNQNIYMGVNTSEGRTDWAKVSNGVLCMSYPRGQSWGAVFITVGEPSPKEKRDAKDFSKYTSLVLELKGEKGATVEVGLKDRLDPDNGNETKTSLSIKEGWNTYELDLKIFDTADLKNLYVVAEFVFANNPQTLCVRKIQLK